MERIRLALQKQGRFSNQSMRILEKIGVGPENGTHLMMNAPKKININLTCAQLPKDDHQESLSVKLLLKIKKRYQTHSNLAL